MIASVVGTAPAEGVGPPTTSTSASTVTVAPADLAPSPLVGPPIPATPLLNSNGTGPGAEPVLGTPTIVAGASSAVPPKKPGPVLTPLLSAVPKVGPLSLL